MATGAELMLKAMGFDPDKLKKEFHEFAGLVLAFNVKLDRIERQQQAIMQHLGVTINEQPTGEPPSVGAVGSNRGSA